VNAAEPVVNVTDDWIVVATDLSQASTEAVAAADLRCRGSDARLLICDVLPNERRPATPRLNQGQQIITDEMDRTAAERSVRRQVRSVTTRGIRDYGVYIGSGLASRSIADLAVELRASLIVIGRRDAEWSSRAAEDSTSDQLARLSRCSLLIVHEANLRGGWRGASNIKGRRCPRRAGRVSDACFTTYTSRRRAAMLDSAE
jgi:nucleotide-binding universal stress UspA family protein